MEAAVRDCGTRELLARGGRVGERKAPQEKSAHAHAHETVTVVTMVPG